MIDAIYDVDAVFESRYHRDVFSPRKDDLVQCFTIHRHFPEFMVLHGVASEVGRQPYRVPSYVRIDQKLLAYFSRQPLDEYVLDSYRKYLDENLKLAEENGINILDLFYWELKLGGWAGLTSSQSDTAGVNLSVFSNRELYRLLLSVDEDRRKEPEYDFYKALIRSMWPKLLEYPINPVESSLKTRVSRLTRKTLHALKLYNHVRAANIYAYYRKNRV